MKQFTYKARNPSGESLSGVIESLSADAAARTLQDRKLLVINISEKKVLDFKKLLSGEFNSVSERDLANFTRLLSTMLSTGLPLTEALSNLIIQAKTGYFREILQSILHDVQSGMTLSDAMAHCGNTFSELYINLVRAGEASGKVDETLARMADTIEANLDFKGKVTGAMIYPAVLVTAMTGIAIFMITTIIPKIAEVYEEYGSELPVVTQVLLGIADLFRNYLIVVIFSLFLLYLVYRSLRKNPTSDFLLNNLFFKVPVFGPLNRETALTLICRTLSILLASGVAILDALRIVSKTVANNYFRAGLIETAQLVEKGMPLSLALRHNPEFPLMLSQLTAIGEETGTVDQSLERMAKFYQDSTERKVKNLTTLLEPMMLLLMGGMIGGLAIAVLMPIFNLVSVIH